ncbi:MAG: SRPBCC family protein [Novosphingobium sp.]
MGKLLSFKTAGLIGLAVLASAPAQAEVIARTDTGFVVRVTGEVAASPAEAWKAFTTPSLWWNPQHTFSGEAANLGMDPSANGCFCERLPVPKGAPPTQKPGSVMHMRVVYAEPYRALRLVGGLGPLQSEAVNGTMTVTFKPVDGSSGKATRILWEYVVGGFMRYKTETISGAVDKVLAEQIAGLTKLIGPSSPAPVPASAPSSRPGPESDGEPAPALIAEPLPEAVSAGEEAAEVKEVPSYTPDPTKDDAAAGESVKSALDQLFRQKDDRLPPGR